MYELVDYKKFVEQVLEGIKRSIEKDISILRGLTVKEQNDALAILYIVARSACYEVTKENLGDELGTSWRETQLLLDILEKIGLLHHVGACGKEGGRKGTGKFYLPIPLRAVLATDKGFQLDKGTIREEFFIQHTLHCTAIRKVCYPKGQRRKPDFLMDGKYFEVGGRSKGKSQKADYYILEGTSAESNIIPLFLWGFLY